MFMGILEERKSVRKFTNKQISHKIVEDILRAGQLAPSGKNRQPWRFIVSYQNRKRNYLINCMKNTITKLIKKSPDRNDLYMALETVDIMYSAPVVIFVCYKFESTITHNDGVDWPLSYKESEIIDILSIGAAIENMLIKAQEYGIGSLWCGDVLYTYNALMKELNTDYPLLSAVCFGYSGEKPVRRFRLPLTDIYKFL